MVGMSLYRPHLNNLEVSVDFDPTLLAATAESGTSFFKSFISSIQSGLDGVYATYDELADKIGSVFVSENGSVSDTEIVSTPPHSRNLKN